MKITKAIIAVAGYGTRRLPITKVIEKCMLPICNRPLIDYIVEDCMSAGITDIYFVVSDANTQLESYYTRNKKLEKHLIDNNKQAILPLIALPAGISFHYIVQPNNGKYGTAIPISAASSFIEDGESVVVLMGDDLIYNSDGSSELARLINATPDDGCSLLGVNINPEQVSRYGVLQLDGDNNFVKIVEKPSVEAAPSTMINVSKYIISYDLLQLINSYANTIIKGEYMITEPINQYISSGHNIKVVRAEGEYLDGGTLEGWLYANNVMAGNI